MKMFNPAKASRNIKNEFVDYIATIHSFSDALLQEQLVESLKETVSQGPIIEIKDIFKTGKTISELIDEQVLSKLFIDLEDKKPKTKICAPKLPLDRALYLHQEKAVRSIVSGKNVVVSTGTGSGKTNCFLIPVLNELLKEKEAGTLNKGVRALFIYPMNALSNDQMKNIREVLMCYPDITFGSYNGGTEYGEEDAIAVYEAMFAKERIEKLRHKLDNEILSRDEMKINPPNILFTNYAMLEHMLFRPKDDVLFSNADFKFVVLDEAHVYNGATGIETAILLRRLIARITATRPTQFVLTSATLGNDSSVDDDIIKFANNLCGVDFEKENIIRATRDSYVSKINTMDYPIELFRELANEENIVWQVLQNYKVECEKTKDEKELLYDLLINSTLYHRMRQTVSGFNDLHDFAKQLNLSIDDTIAFVSICTRAQKNRKSLIDARYHFFIKSLEGCYVTLQKEKKLFLNRQKTHYENGEKYTVFEIAICDDCGKFAFVGKIEERKLTQASKLGDEVDFYYPLDNRENILEEDDSFEIDADKKVEVYYLCKECGAIVRDNEMHILPCECGKDKFIKVAKGRQLSSGVKCGNCNLGYYKRMYLGNDAATSVLATALYEELPELEFQEDEESTKVTNIFAKAAFINKKKSKKTGRQFLVFSDSRQEAAKFACYLGKSYNEFLRRRGIWKLIKERKSEIIEHEYSISDFVKLLTNYFTTMKSFAKSNIDESNLTIDSRKNAWVAMLNELARFKSSTSLTSLGQIQFEYLGNRGLDEAVSMKYSISKDDAKNLLDLLVFEIVKSGAIITDTDSDIDDNDREYIYFTPSQKFVSYLVSPDKKTSLVASWAPRNKVNKVDAFHKSNKLYLTCRVLKISEKDACEFLKDYFDYLTKPDLGNHYCMTDVNKNGTYAMPAKHFVVNISGSKNAKWFKCKKCGRVTQFTLSGKCSTFNCEGDLVEMDPAKIEEQNHYAKLYSGERMSPLFIKEHTAQLSKKESAEYQQQFIKKEINALSCSTTFEMGVDVGDLETVFLRNVPPLPSNYAQRAGRAGRSVNAAAFALTFAKLSSHDFAFFKNPELMIRGIILPPLFKLDNEKIIRRHIYAVSLGMFFAENENMYNHNNANEFINKKGYLQLIEWLNGNPQKLKELLIKSIPNTEDLHNRIGINDFGWIKEFLGEEGVFTQLIKEYETNIANFESQIKKLKKDDVLQAASYESKMHNYMSNKLIEFLARGNILPKYGFPVDTVELYQNTTAKSISKLRLSRDLQIAIAEYAPSSEVIADGRMYTSRYIKKSSIGTNRQDWHTAFIGKCDNPECETINYSLVPVTSEGIDCISCGKKIERINFFESIEPRSGFVAERSDKDVPLTKQEKNYKSEDYYIGNKSAKKIDKVSFSFNEIEITMESTSNDSLLVKSTSSFYVCPQCGYSIADDESIGEPKIEKQMQGGKALRITTERSHESLFGKYPCHTKELRRMSLHHVFNTDVAKITFGCDTSDYNTMISVMYAVLNSISMVLNIERKDIKACLSRKISQNDISEYSIIIYDSVPGGAGHTRRLVTKDGNQFYSILMHAKTEMDNCNCDPSCYRCLRSYGNQKIHDKLDRKLAYEFLKKMEK